MHQWNWISRTVRLERFSFYFISFLIYLYLFIFRQSFFWKLVHRIDLFLFFFFSYTWYQTTTKYTHTNLNILYPPFLFSLRPLLIPIFYPRLAVSIIFIFKLPNGVSRVAVHKPSRRTHSIARFPQNHCGTKEKEK